MSRQARAIFTSPRQTAPMWQTVQSSVSAGEEDQPPAAMSSSRAHSRQHPYTLSTSAPPRVPSPPGFSLSTGAPLVNPPAKTQAAFVGKLYAMLEDEDILKTGLIHWSPDGSIFTCPNPTEFAKVVLPRFFKHNNWQSFVRQLNMYSFNKVNDVFATTSDPQAWEFRHPLFRRGEPHLLASIKRKSTRPNHADKEATSPEEAETPRAVAGWMRERERDRAPGWRSSPPPQEYAGRVYGYNMQTGETVVPRPSEPNRGPSSLSLDSHPPLSASLRQQQSEAPRYHPDPNRPPLPPQHFAGFPESPYYPQPPTSHPSPAEALVAQVTSLEDRVMRLTELLNRERVDHARSSLDFASYLSKIAGWIGVQQPPPPLELHSLQDTLTRAISDYQHRYEQLMASDALASLASGGLTIRDQREERARVPLDPPLSARAPTLPDPRLTQANPTPRSSPLMINFPTGPPSQPTSHQLHPAHPTLPNHQTLQPLQSLQSSHSRPIDVPKIPFSTSPLTWTHPNNHAHTRQGRVGLGSTPSSSSEGTILPPLSGRMEEDGELDFRDRDEVKSRERKRDHEKERERKRERVDEDDKMEDQEHVESKPSLRNLLN
ncbi:hypothetical protein M231_04923 [Tremella mesenterica]|uniref:HSF-type DNA-binding domain-containing protein n=1 Tax=Tremella mesenterica TaxID=5217 RepID=A0A4V1M3R3_TREME|nr:hypothetical protein M231_04923 [Tremella mesenterica]